RREYCARPEPASSTEKPPGAGRTAWSSVALPVNTSCSVTLGKRLSTTSRMARPRPASSTSPRSPRSASAAARLAATKVLPTPPLPLVTARIFPAALMVPPRLRLSPRRCPPRGRSTRWGGPASCSWQILELRGAEQQALLLGADERDRGLLEAGAVAAFRLGAVELLVGALDPEQRRRAHPPRGERGREG